MNPGGAGAEGAAPASLPRHLPDVLRQGLARRRCEVMQLPGFRRAAVLVPLLEGPAGAELLFTVRSAALSNHAGQISFPGGRIEAGEGPEEAALRETAEEIGVTPPPSGILGRLDDLPSPANYVVTPVLGYLQGPLEFRPNPREVAEVFTVPLARLRALSPRTEERRLRDMRRLLYFYDVDERTIWGLTGNIVKQLLDVLAAVPQELH